MRLFAAVDPPAEVRAELDAALGDRSPELRWVPPEQWHVTLAFYGEVVESRVDDLTARLARAGARTSAFALRLAGAGTFPGNAGRGRHLWIGLTGEVDVLSHLARSCAAAGRRVGVPIEDRRYRPHLTLARARGREADMRAAVGALSGFSSRPWTVSELRLVHSTLGRTVTHRPLATMPLGSSANDGIPDGPPVGSA